MSKQFNIENLHKIVACAISEQTTKTKQEFKPRVGADVPEDNMEINTDSYKETVQRIKDFDGGAIDDKGLGYTKTGITETTTQNDIDNARLYNNRGQERIKYDMKPDGFDERVQSQVMGKTSPIAPDADDLTQGISTQGNEKFLKDRAIAGNKFDDAHAGVNDGKSIVQLGDVAIPTDTEPIKKVSAFENKNTTPIENKMIESKVKIGETFIKEDLVLKLTGLNEEKNRFNFLDESTNKKYSLSKDNFRKALVEGKMSRKPIQEGEVVNEQKIRTLKLKRDVILDEGHAKFLIPENYKKENSKFYIKDDVGNSYLIEWTKADGAVVLEYENKNKEAEQKNRMKTLWEYKSSDFNQRLGNDGRVNENSNVGRFIKFVKEKE